MTHPSSLALEAFACGEDERSVRAHIDACTACQTFVERTRGALTAGPSSRRAADAVTRAAGRVDDERSGQADESTRAAPSSARARARSRWHGWVKASTVAVPLAAAAALLVLLKTPSTNDSLSSSSSSSSSTLGRPGLDEPSAAPGDPEPETSFKGGIHIAVIRDRAGHQQRFTGSVAVKPGDRLRVEVALDREQAILAAVMGDDASWLELMTEGARRPGTHFSERSARVDASPMRGTIVVGAPDAVARARAAKRFDDVATIRVEWEAP